jgi:hypothetical protein
VIGGLRNVVSGSAKYTIEISSTVSPMLCMWMVRYGNKEAVAIAIIIAHQCVYLQGIDEKVKSFKILDSISTVKITWKTWAHKRE